MKVERRPYRQTTRATAAAATREGILDVATEHFLTRYYDDVTLAAIAAEAGVTQQTVINHFASKGGLLEVAVDRFDFLRGRRTAAGDPVAGVVADYEASGDAIHRMLTLEERVPALVPFLARGRAAHRAWVAEAFAERLGDPAAAGYERALKLHVVALDLYTWKLLRRDMGLSRAETVDHLRSLIAALA